MRSKLKGWMYCCAALLALAIVAPANAADILADWTFETSQPAGAAAAGVAFPNPPAVAEAGEYAASSAGLGWHFTTATYSSPVGNGSLHSFSVTNWTVNDYWQFSVPTTGHTGISIEFDQTSSNTGPRDFILKYSTDNVTYTQFGSQWAVPANAAPLGPWSGTVHKTGFHFAFDLSSITALDNKANVYFRLIDNSTVSANGRGEVPSMATADRLMEPPGTVSGARRVPGVTMLRRSHGDRTSRRRNRRSRSLLRLRPSTPRRSR